MLPEVLADALPEDVKLTSYHLSTPPTTCHAIFSARPGQNPEQTYCESHFLAVSIQPETHHEQKLLLFAIEVLIYTTDRLTTLFVSKADSTGYLHLLKLSPGTPSLIKTISLSFLHYLVRTQQRPNVPLVLSLFARSQNQYLFPGSIENNGKHVLDDRSLIKWWCRVLDPILRHYGPDQLNAEDGDYLETERSSVGAQAYLIVPGCDRNETKTFFPPSAKRDSPTRLRWHNCDPLYQLSTKQHLPPRCLIPRFPDDPKARFLDDLDDEIPGISTATESPSKWTSTGQWRSVKSLEQFWEMMAFRQECSAGRLVGFVWVVFTPKDEENADAIEAAENHQIVGLDSQRENGVLPTPKQSQTQDSLQPPPELVMELLSEIDMPSSPLPSSPPPVLEDIDQSCQQGTSQKEGVSGATRYFIWPEDSRGTIILDQEQYKEINDFLLRLDFADEKLATASSIRWIDRVAELSGRKDWGKLVVGAKAKAEPPNGGAEPTSNVNVIKSDLVRKRKAGEQGVEQVDSNAAEIVKVLSSGLIKKKKKGFPLEQKESEETDLASDGVNVLDGGLIRKKAKT